MVIASLYILVRSTRNRIVVRLRRLREPRYLFGAVIGVAYLYFAIFGPRRAASRRGGAAPGGAALLTSSVRHRRRGLLMAGLAWLFPGRAASFISPRRKRTFPYRTPVASPTLDASHYSRNSVCSSPR
jgi:hypothetical protein